MYWLNNALHVLLPAFALASAVVVLARLLQWRKKQCLSFAWHWLCLFIAGAGVRIGALLWLQSDGAMLGYVALVLVVGSIQAFLARRAQRAVLAPVAVEAATQEVAPE